ncbi:hypothetical protein PV327_010102 [Microctonus hyperodae]|uniref:Uncharacterized protein n=1 Tax=Microctonus hyperodae TaxID=165561 RepID=A0AA39KGH9_MICHY|nr:hypothetical protein PV327_010102 [Microctonus hyperodae]
MQKPKWSSDIWKTISKELGYKWGHDAVGTNVNNIRRNILTIALQECGYFSKEVKAKSSTYDDDENKNNDYNSSSDDEDNNINDPDYDDHSACFEDLNEIEEFDVEICRELWNTILQPSVDINNRQCLKLKKKVWTDVIAYAFWEQYRLKCAFIFDQGRISFNERKMQRPFTWLCRRYSF